MNRPPIFHPPVKRDHALAVGDAARALEQLGHRVTEDFPGALDDDRINRAFGRVVAAGEARQAEAASELLGRPLEAGDFDPWTWFLIERGRRIAAADYLAACDYFNEFSRSIGRWFSEGSFDVLVTPTTPAAAPPLGYFKVGANERPGAVGARLNWMTAFTMPWNITGLPAVSLPLNITEDGLPVGVQFVARYGREDVLVRLAAQLEKAVPWSSRRPPTCA